MTQQITADQVIEQYVKTRDLILEKKRALEAELEDLEALQQRRETWLRGEMDRLGVDSFKTPHGTCFTDFKDSATVKDREAFFAWVREHEAWEYLESRVSKAAVKQALDDGTPPPPGVDYSKVRDVKIRRK